MNKETSLLGDYISDVLTLVTMWRPKITLNSTKIIDNGLFLFDYRFI